LTEEVIFTGQKTLSELEIYYENSDIYIQGSGYEGLPHVLLEALNYQLSIISTPIGGSNEILKNGENGWILELVDGIKPDSRELVKIIKEVLNDDKIWHFLSKWITPEDATIERKTIYTFKSLVAKKWRKGRVFIAGDAAHLSPPFMGQGMCSGIRDVSNLFWKIAYCCNFGYKEKLLKTYESERLKNVREYIITTINMGRLLNSIGDTNVSNTVKEEKDGSKKMNSIKPPLGPGLGDNKDKLRGKIFPYINLQNTNVSNFDTQFETELVLLSKQNVDNKKIKHINVNKYEEVMKVFNKLNISALILRPDRFILSSLNDNSNINDFIEKSTLQFG